MLEHVEKITKSIDDGKYTIGIFIDIKKAFDTIDHNILQHITVCRSIEKRHGV